ncbi:MAG: CcmD family protein [Longimicrobiaceae bacterium]
MRLSRLAAAVAAALTLAVTPAGPIAAQSAAPPAAVTQSAPLPSTQAPAPPRTLRAYWHVFIAFGLAWLFLFGYALSLGRRFRNLEREVEALK